MSTSCRSPEEPLKSGRCTPSTITTQPTNTSSLSSMPSFTYLGHSITHLSQSVPTPKQQIFSCAKAPESLPSRLHCDVEKREPDAPTNCQNTTCSLPGSAYNSHDWSNVLLDLSSHQNFSNLGIATPTALPKCLSKS